MIDRSLRVLIAEDEPLLALEYELLLIDHSHKVSGIAFRLQQALDLVQRNNYDLAIIDLNLAGETALSLVEELKIRSTPLILITAYSAVVDACFENVPVFTKPVDRSPVIASGLFQSRRPS